MHTCIAHIIYKMSIYTRMHTYIHSYVHTCIHAYMHTCIHAYMHTCIHAYMHTHMHAYTHACIHTCMHNITCMYPCTCMHNRTCIYTIHFPQINITYTTFILHTCVRIASGHVWELLHKHNTHNISSTPMCEYNGQ